MTDSKTVIEQYAHSCQIVEEEREGDYNKYHYEGPMGWIKTFENPDKARLYADVHTVKGGFRGEKTGERGDHLPSHNPVSSISPKIVFENT